jgi:hypothetical protein
MSPARHSPRGAPAIATDGGEATVMQRTTEYAERRAGARRPAESDPRQWVMALAPYATTIHKSQGSQYPAELAPVSTGHLA